MASSTSWEELLNRSRKQLSDVAASNSLFPPIERNLDQLEVLSRQLKARASHLEVGDDTTAATRLLAREGFNADQLTQNLRSFELKTSFEDVFPVEAVSVDDYLTQVHEMSMLAPMQEAQRNTLASLDAYMLHLTQEEWEREKREFLHGLSRVAPSGGPEHGPLSSLQGAAGALQGTASGALPALRGRQGQPLPPVGTSKSAAYAQAVQQLNREREQRTAAKIATVMLEAHERSSGEAAGQRSVSMLKMWRLVQALVGEDGGHRSTPGGSRNMAMVRAAQHHLEAGHARYMLDVIHSHPAQAALGGSTSNLHRVRAFLRVRLRDQGPLDFDAREGVRLPPLDTTWQQIYYCLRSGYYEEAQQVAQASRAARALAPQLAEWVARGGSVSAATAAALSEECERMARAGERQGHPSYDKKRMLVHAVLSGGQRPSDLLSRDVPALFATIEDFMWFKLAMLRGEVAGPGPGRPPEACTLEELQAYLSKFGAAYYTKGGKDPLVYPYVLLLSLQLHAAVLYLVRDAPTDTFRLDGIHIGLALALTGALQEAAPPPRGRDAARDVSGVVRQYGASLLRAGDVPAALEYYAAAAAALRAGGGEEREHQVLLEQLLRELLRLPAGADLLLGRTGISGGALRRFVATEGERRELVVAAARESQDARQLDEAVELLARADAHADALSILNRRLSDGVSLIASGNAHGTSVAASMLQAGDQVIAAHSLLGGATSSAERLRMAEQQVSFRQLAAMVQFYGHLRAGKYRDALQALVPLNFLPMEGRSVDACLEALRATSSEVEDRLPGLLEAMSTCLSHLPHSDAAIGNLRREVVSLVANCLQRNWPQAVYESVARMQSLPPPA